MSTQAASQTGIRLYQVVHEMFRRTTTRLVDAAAKTEPSALQPVIGAHGCSPRWTR